MRLYRKLKLVPITYIMSTKLANKKKLFFLLKGIFNGFDNMIFRKTIFLE